MSLPRIRRHTDGRVALWTGRSDRYPWHVSPPPGRDVLPAAVAGIGLCRHVSDEDVSGEGWSELIAVELPEPAEVDGDIATFGGHCISAGADPNAVEAWRRYAGHCAAIAAWGERPPGGDPR